MSILSLSSDILRKIILLSEKREKLLAEVGQVESQIRALEASGSGQGAKAVQKAVPPVSRGRHGAIKDRVLAELQTVGAEGVKVTELAVKLGVKPQNLHVWFSSTGRKLGIRKVGPARYAL